MRTLADIDIDPGDDPAGWRAARNSIVTDLRLYRVAPIYAAAHTDVSLVHDWAAAFQANPADAPWLLLFGPVGTGKTHNAIAALRLAVKAPRTVAWELVTCSQLLDDLRPGGPAGAEQRYTHADLLILDDLTMVKTNTEWAIETLFRIIDTRRRTQRPTVVTANVPPKQLAVELSEQIVSRIAQNCVVIPLAGEDRRRAPTS